MKFMEEKNGICLFVRIYYKLTFVIFILMTSKTVPQWSYEEEFFGESISSLPLGYYSLPLLVLLFVALLIFIPFRF